MSRFRAAPLDSAGFHRSERTLADPAQHRSFADPQVVRRVVDGASPSERTVVLEFTARPGRGLESAHPGSGDLALVQPVRTPAEPHRVQRPDARQIAHLGRGTVDDPSGLVERQKLRHESAALCWVTHPQFRDRCSRSSQLTRAAPASIHTLIPARAIALRAPDTLNRSKAAASAML